MEADKDFESETLYTVTSENTKNVATGGRMNQKVGTRLLAKLVTKFEPTVERGEKRSYFSCTNSKCTVKKRVEPSSEDPTIIITTYEGQHCHHSAGFARGGLISHEVAFARQFNPAISQIYHPHGIQLHRGIPPSTTQSHQVPIEVRESRSLPKGEGLLGDIVPPGMHNR
ncbi:probable WRKY transcription factor 57 [Hibiscus syriacus]|uniref:probable WRKY transcription factor 57 n=1 Tax=Hibiscus syriacus TaxID=106335 RepID=UPI0019228F83|nr:probable WRKY transcription factor 57 [Hibiscus syriacus]